MTKEFLSYFNLHSLPFTKEIAVSELLNLPTVEKVRVSLKTLIQTRGIGVMTGESGSGKSCLIRMMKAELHQGLYTLIYLCHSSIGLLEFYSHLCAGFGLESAMKRATMFRTVQDRILTLNKSSNIHPILVVDEAHRLSDCVKTPI